MNQGTLTGRVVRNPKLFKNGKKPVARFTLEIPREIGKSRDYVNVTAFADWADKIERWLQAGTEVKIDYTVQSSTYERDGKPVYAQDLVVTNVATLSGSKAPVVEPEAELATA